MDSKLPDIGTTIFAVMSALSEECDAINLSQGFPSFNPNQALLDRVTYHLNHDGNQYAPMTSVPSLRQAIAAKVASLYGRSIDADSEITVTDGATEGLFSAIHAVVRPGDEVIVFDPAYDSYEPAVTLASGGIVLKYDGVDWVEQTRSNLQQMWDMWGSADNDIYVVGRAGTRLHYDGNRWEDEDTGTRSTFFTVWGRDSNDVYIAGESSLIYHWDGLAWTKQDPAHTLDIYSMGGSAESLWGVGVGGRIVRYNGSQWKSDISPTTSVLEKIFVTPGGRPFVVGRSGTILHRESSWTVMNEDPADHLRGAWVCGDGTEVVVGAGGTVLVNESAGWVDQEIATVQTLWSAWGSTADHIVVVGNNGSIWQRDNAGWTLQTGMGATFWDVWAESESHVVAEDCTDDVTRVLRVVPPIVHHRARDPLVEHLLDDVYEHTDRPHRYEAPRGKARIE